MLSLPSTFARSTAHMKSQFLKRLLKRRIRRGSSLNRTLAFESLETRQMLTEYVVQRIDLDLSVPNPGPNDHTLRSAILAANNHTNVGGPDIVTIPSNLAGGTITLNSAITITDPVIIRSPFGQTLIQLSGLPAVGFNFNMSTIGTQDVSAITGFNISGFTSSIVVTELRENDSLVITGNRIQNNSSNGIEIKDASFGPIEISNCEISGNVRGVYVHSISGTSPFNGTLNIINSTTTGGQNLIHSNSSHGIDISGFSSSSATSRRISIANNAVYNNGTGMRISGADAPLTIEGNKIGLNLAGAVQPNQTGVSISVNDVAASSTIAFNEIAGNSGSGLLITSVVMPGLDIANNSIGVDASSTSKPNAGSGVVLTNSSFRKLVGNVIASNGGDGLRLSNVQAGTVGTTTAGEGNFVILNGGDGIELSDGTSNISVEGNTVSSNAGAGIHLAFNAGAANSLSENTFGGNTGQAIDIESATSLLGFNSNDSNDSDGGPNLLQNYADLRKPVPLGGGAWQLPIQLDVPWKPSTGAGGSSPPCRWAGPICSRSSSARTST